MICCGEFEGELVDEGEGVDGWVDVEPEFLERELGRGVEGMLQLGKQSLIILARTCQGKKTNEFSSDGP